MRGLDIAAFTNAYDPPESYDGRCSCHGADFFWASYCEDSPRAAAIPSMTVPVRSLRSSFMRELPAEELRLEGLRLHGAAAAAAAAAAGHLPRRLLSGSR